MVKSTQYRNSNHLVSSLMRGMRRSARLRNLLLNPLMRSGLIEVRHIPMKYTLKLFLVKVQQVVETLSWLLGLSVPKQAFRSWLSRSLLLPTTPGCLAKAMFTDLDWDAYEWLTESMSPSLFWKSQRKMYFPIISSL